MSRDLLGTEIGTERLTIDLRSIVAIQKRGDAHFIHTVGGPITVTPDVASAVRRQWEDEKRYRGEG